MKLCHFAIIYFSITSSCLGLTQFGSLQETSFGTLESSDFQTLKGDVVRAVFEDDGEVRVYLYTDGYCPHCEVAEKKIKNDAPWIDLVVVTDYPNWVTSFPTFHWNAEDGTGRKLVKGWDNRVFDELVELVSPLRKVSHYADLPSGAQPTPYFEVHRILALINPKKDEVFVDYGCGFDARFCVAASSIYGCRSIGVEIDHDRAESAKKRVRELGLEDLVTIIEGDATKVNVDADVGVAYLWPDVLSQMKDKIEELDRFASYQHQVPGMELKESGNAFVWNRQEKQYAMKQESLRNSKVAYWNGVAYTGRVCGNSGCRMCNSISRQLSK